MGLGTPFHSSAYESLYPLLDSSRLEVVASLDIPPGNLAVSLSGRIFFNFHPEYNPEVKIAELVKGSASPASSTSSWKAYPDVAFQREITTVLSMRFDKVHNRLWLLDFGLHGVISTPKLVSILIDSDEVYSMYLFPSEIAGFGSMLNDFAVSENGDHLYIADTSIVAQTPAIVVYSVQANSSHRLLSSSPSLYGQSSFFNVGSHEIGFGPFGMKINVDSIAISRDNRALYFAPLTGSDLFCVEVALLHAAMCSTDDEDCFYHKKVLADSVRVVLHDKPITDGITTDNDGNVWMTALGHSSIGVATPSTLPSSTSKCEGPDSSEAECQGGNENELSSPVCRPLKMSNVIHSTELLRWVDGFSFGPDGLYVTNSALYMKFNNLPLPAEAPYHIIKLGVDALYQTRRHLVANADDAAGACPSTSTDADDGNVRECDIQLYMNTLKKLTGQ